MTRRIHKLPDLLVNKIAAGEVVERPSSVVKELLENALDAGATHIQLTLEDGGRKLIRITDNGHGIPLDQLELAVTPHATSKIQHEDDLFRIGTLGFRGEALASIGSVSHLQLTSRTADSLEGGRIDVSGEKIQNQGITGCPIGTTIEVRDLFFNVPARRKFLKSASTEMGHIQEQLIRVAMPNQHVEFELATPQRSLKHLKPHIGIGERVGHLFGTELLGDLISLHREDRGLTITGMIAKPVTNKTSSKFQYIFLNGRFIRDRFVQHAIKEAYRGLMEPSRYPVVFLFMNLDPEQVDVNVHPTKIEVRWRDSNIIYSQVLSALRETLLQHDLTPALKSRRASIEASPEQIRQERQRIADFFKQAPTPRMETYMRTERKTGDPSSTSVTLTHLADMYQSAATPATDDETASPALVRPRALQIHRTYLVTETDEGLLVIDQHALHERILYEQLKQRFTAGNLESQRLLVPETIRMTAEQAAAIDENASLLERIGIEVSLYGEETVAVQSFPTIVKQAVIHDFVLDLADRLTQKGSQLHTEVVIHEMLDMMACKAAVKAGDPMTEAEIQELIDQRHLVEKSSNCPHGRPTTLRFSIADLERQFKRT